MKQKSGSETLSERHIPFARKTLHHKRTVYAFARLAGCSTSTARMLREWTVPHVVQFLNGERERLTNKRRTKEYREWKHARNS